MDRIKDANFHGKSSFAKRNLAKGEIVTSRVAGLDINLSASDPLERLAELCSQGKYSSDFHWDKYSSGIMIELELSYEIGGRRRILTKEVRYVSGTNDLAYARRVVAAILLERLGLDRVPDYDEVSLSDEDQKGDDAIAEVKNFAKGLFAGDEDLLRFATTSLANMMSITKEEFNTEPLFTDSPLGGVPQDDNCSQSKTQKEGKSWADIVSEEKGQKVQWTAE